MEYSEAFEAELSALEACAVRLAAAEDGSAEHADAERELPLFVDDLVNSYPVDARRVVDHADEVARIHRTRDHESTATKHVATVHEAFLDEVCDDYDPVY